MKQAELHWNRIMHCYKEQPASVWSQFQRIMDERSDHIVVIDENELKSLAMNMCA